MTAPKDGNGYLSLQELTEAMTATNSGISDDEVKSIFGRMTRAKPDEISFDEFVPGILNRVSTIIDEYVDTQGASGFFLSSEQVDTLLLHLGLTERARLLTLLASWIKTRSHPVVSGFEVGAVGLDISGNVYLGVNIELDRSELNLTVHAEQCLLYNAFIHGARKLTRVGLTAMPCGHCRQFMQELTDPAELIIHQVNDRQEFPLRELLPHAFGPADLGVPAECRMLAGGTHELEMTDKRVDLDTDELAREAVAVARRAYAPYSGHYSGMAVRIDDGTVLTGTVIESCAYNPSIGPMQAIAISMAMICEGVDFARITDAVLVEPPLGQISHASAVKANLGLVAPGATLRVLPIGKPGKE